MKKLTSLLLVVAMVLGLVGVLPAQAQQSDSHGEFIEMNIAFPANAAGAMATYDILFNMDNTFRFQSGDKLEYDVWLSHDIGGAGGLELCSGALMLRGYAYDDRGIGAHPVADLSDYAYGKWYSRAITVPDTFVGVDFSAGGPCVIPAVEIVDCAALAGQTLTVRYDNIRITRNGEAVQEIYPGQNSTLPATPGYYYTSNPVGATVSYSFGEETAEPAPDIPAEHGEYIEMTVDVGAAAAGGITSYDILWNSDSTFRYQSGDKLEYDVWISHDVAGLGGLELCFGYENSQVLRATAADDNGIGAHPMADISDYACGKWYSRAITIPASFVGVDFSAGGPCVIPAIEIADAAVLAGQTVTVRYDNIRITRGGETVQEIYPGLHSTVAANPGDYVPLNNANVSISYAIAQEASDPVETAHGDVLQMTMDVADDVSGAHCYYNEMFTVPDSVVLQSGDKLVYDVYLHDELSGVGTIDMYAGNDLSVNLRDDVQCVDQTGLRNHPTVSLTALALDRWYTRQVSLSDAFVSGANSSTGNRAVAVIACDKPEMQYYAGQTLRVSFDNVCIMRGNEVVYTIFAGREDPVPETFTYMMNLSGNAKVTTSFQIVDTANNEDWTVGGDTATGPQNPDSEAMTQTVVFKQIGNKSLKMDIFQPTNRVYEKAPVLYLIVGGGWTTAVRGDMVNFLSGTVSQLRQQGFAVTTIDYRVQSSGADMYDMVSDCMDGIRYLVKHQEALDIDTGKIITAGHSAGGQLSLMMALGQQSQFVEDSQLAEYAYDLAGCVSISPVTVCYEVNGTLPTLSSNLVDLFDSVEQAKTCSPLDILTADTCPILITTGKADNIVDPNNTYWFAEKAQELGANVTMLTSENAGHSYEPMNGAASVSMSLAQLQTKIAEYAVSIMNGGPETPDVPANPNTDGKYIEKTIQIGDDAAGGITSYDILWNSDSTFVYQSGDKLEYDVWISHDVAGLGGLELCFGYENSQVLRATAADDNGIGAHPMADISDYACGKWYSRAITIPESFVGVDFSAGGPCVIPAIEIGDCSGLAGETVTVRYDNIRITRGGETVQEIYPGLHSTVAANPGDYVPLNNANVSISYAIAEEAVTPEPPVLHGDYVETTLQIGENAVGNILSYDILWFTDNTFVYQPGDRLEYDVWMSHDLAGIGSLDLCSGGITLRDSGAIDTNGIYVHADFGDISDHAHNKWYSRSIGITDIFNGVDFTAGGPAVVVPVSIADSAALAGETVTVRYDNIRITRNGETVQAIFPGFFSTVDANPSDYVPLSNANVTQTYAIGTDTPAPAPQIASASLELGGILNLNVTASNSGAEDILRATIGEDVQEISLIDGVYSVKLPAHRMYESVKLELISGDEVVDTQTWTMEAYTAALRQDHAENAAMMALLNGLENYGTYIDHYAKGTVAPANSTVDAVKQADLADSKLNLVKGNSGLKPVTALYLDDACDLLVKFDATAFAGCKLLIDNVDVTADVIADENGKVAYRIEELLPQDWSKLYNIKVTDADNTVLFEANYSVLSYAYINLGKPQEVKTGLNGLLKAMYLYCKAANEYKAV